MIESRLRARLLSDPTIAASCGDRVYPCGAPFAPTYPYVVFARKATTRTQHNEGYSGITTSRTLLVAVSRDYGEAWSIMDAVRRCCDGMRGSLAGAEVMRVQVVDDQDIGIAPQSADEAWLYTVSAVAIIDWQESQPFV